MVEWMVFVFTQSLIIFVFGVKWKMIQAAVRIYLKCFLCRSSRGKWGAVRSVHAQVRGKLPDPGWQGWRRCRLCLHQVCRFHQRADSALQEPGEEPKSASESETSDILLWKVLNVESVVFLRICAVTRLPVCSCRTWTTSSHSLWTVCWKETWKEWKGLVSLSSSCWNKPADTRSVTLHFLLLWLKMNHFWLDDMLTVYLQ